MTSTLFALAPLPAEDARAVAERAIALAAQHTPATAKTAVPSHQRFVKALNPGQSVMLPHLLRGTFALSAKTATATKHLCAVDDVSTVSGASVEYKGAPLAQADLRVLLGLIQHAAGLVADNAVLTIDAREFLTSIGRGTCSRSIDALRDSLTSLRSATFVVKEFARDRGQTLCFVDDVDWNGRALTVKLSGRASWAFYGLGRTYLDTTKRNLLADGVQTALADLLRATTATSFDVVALSEVWGREPKEFGREVRAALGRLVEVGVLASWSKTRGRVHVVRTEG